MILNEKCIFVGSQICIPLYPSVKWSHRTAELIATSFASSMGDWNEIWRHGQSKPQLKEKLPAISILSRGSFSWWTYIIRLLNTYLSYNLLKIKAQKAVLFTRNCPTKFSETNPLLHAWTIHKTRPKELLKMVLSSGFPPCSFSPGHSGSQMLLLALQRKKHTEHFRLLQRMRTGWTFDRERLKCQKATWLLLWMLKCPTLTWMFPQRKRYLAVFAPNGRLSLFMLIIYDMGCFFLMCLVLY